MRTQLIMVVFLVCFLQGAEADAGMIRGIKRVLGKPVKVVRNLLSLPEYLMVDLACAVSAWYRYEVCER